MTQHEAEPGTGIASPVRLGGKYEIVPGRPLPELQSANATACVAVNLERSSEQLYALICSPHLEPRLPVIEALNAHHLEAVLTPVAWGVVDWAPGRRRSFAMILDRPAGGRIATAQTEVITPIPEDDIVHHVLPLLVTSLRTLFTGGLTHRAIRPTNLYRQGVSRQILLGECVSTPPAVLQPLACEPIESGMADPFGRGDGTPADDLYALGATLLFLLLGRDPTAELTDKQLLEEKVNRGSYVALLGASRIPSRMVEAVRGLLADDPRERWTLADLDLWLQGRRIAPKQFAFTKRAARPLEFCGLGYFTARSLSQALANDPSAAARLLKSPDFDIWMQRSLSEPERSAAVAAALSDVSEVAGGMQDSRLVARVCTALDPLAPVRYGDFAAAIDGFGTAVAAAFCGKGSLQAVGQAIGARLPQFWFAAQAALRPEQAILLKGFEKLRFYLEDRRPGFGLERVLYEMNPLQHCLSPLVERDYVVGATDLLRALELAVTSGRAEGDLVDRHIAAFISVHFRMAGADWQDALASPEPHRRAFGTLQVLSRLQNLRGPPSVPALSDRLARLLPPMIDRFHNRPRRAHLRQELAKIAPKGSLVELLALVDDNSHQRHDLQAFTNAQREYASIEQALGILKVGAPARPAHAAALGGRFSVTTANVLAWVTALTAAVLGR